MSLYQVQKLLFNIHNDLELRQRYSSHPREILEKYVLTESERQALLGHDMGAVDTAFDMEFLNLVKAADVEEFVRRVTPEALKKAGVATELLAWVALLGVLGPVEPAFTDYIWGKKWSSGAASMVLWKP